MICASSKKCRFTIIRASGDDDNDCDRRDTTCNNCNNDSDDDDDDKQAPHGVLPVPVVVVVAAVVVLIIFPQISPSSPEDVILGQDVIQITSQNCLRTRPQSCAISSWFYNCACAETFRCNDSCYILSCPTQ